MEEVVVVHGEPKWCHVDVSVAIALGGGPSWDDGPENVEKYGPTSLE